MYKKLPYGCLSQLVNQASTQHKPAGTGGQIQSVSELGFSRNQNNNPVGISTQSSRSQSSTLGLGPASTRAWITSIRIFICQSGEASGRNRGGRAEAPRLASLAHWQELPEVAGHRVLTPQPAGPANDQFFNSDVQLEWGGAGQAAAGCHKEAGQRKERENAWSFVGRAPSLRWGKSSWEGTSSQTPELPPGPQLADLCCLLEQQPRGSVGMPGREGAEAGRIWQY